MENINLNKKYVLLCAEVARILPKVMPLYTLFSIWKIFYWYLFNKAGPLSTRKIKFYKMIFSHKILKYAFGLFLKFTYEYYVVRK